MIKVNLQQFAEEEFLDEGDGYELVDGELEDSGQETEEGTVNNADLTEKEEKVKFTPQQQVEINKLIDKVFGKKKSTWEREVSSKLGVKDLNEAVEYTQAGRAVASSAGTSPSEILNRLKARGLYNPTGATQQGSADNDGLKKDIEDMKAILFSEREEKVRSVQEQEAVQTFGKALFTEHENDIREKAEETGLSLVDAAAVVLKSRLPRIAEDRAKAKQVSSKKKSLDTGDGAANSRIDVSTRLSLEQKRTAQKMGLSNVEYYKELKALGRLED